MSEEPEIRIATAADLKGLYALHSAQGYAAEPGYFEDCLAEQDSGHRLVFIAAQGGQDVGYGLLNGHSRYSLYRRLDIPEIQDLNVIPAARRQGVAAACIRWCEAQIRARGATQAGISVGLHAGYGAAQRLYIRLGYVPDGYGVTYDRVPVAAGEIRPVDSNMCLMLVKDL